MSSSFFVSLLIPKRSLAKRLFANVTFTPASTWKFGTYTPEPSLTWKGSLAVSNQNGLKFPRAFSTVITPYYTIESIDAERIKLSFLGSPTNTSSSELAVLLDVRRLDGSGMVLEYTNGNPVTGDFEKETITLKKQ